MMPLRLPSHLRGTVLQPVRKSHIAMGQIECVVSTQLGRNRVLLRKHQTHDLTEFDVVQEEMYMNRIWWVFCWSIWFVIDEVIR